MITTRFLRDWYRTLLLAAALSVLVPSAALAHPHVFIVQYLDIVFEQKGLAGIRVHWQFDDMFASMIAEDHDRNRNGTLEPDEVQSVRQKAFTYIAEYGYFTAITIDGTKFPVTFIRDFKATLTDKKLAYASFSEVWTGFEPVNDGFANRCLTTWRPDLVLCLIYDNKYTKFRRNRQENS